MYTLLEHLLTPHDVPALALDRIRFLEWRALRLSLRMLRLQHKIVAVKAEAEYLSRWYAAAVRARTENPEVLLDKTDGGAP